MAKPFWGEMPRGYTMAIITANEPQAVARGIRFCLTFLHVAARATRAFLACPCVFWLAQRAKKCDTNHIPRAIA